jgi:hypothetical protein
VRFKFLLAVFLAIPVTQLAAQTIVQGGPTAGSDYLISRYSSGSLVDTPFKISQSTGAVTLSGPLNLSASGSTGDISAMSVAPTGSTGTQQTLATVTAQQGVLLDTFKQQGDADDTAAMTRAVAAGVPILLGPKTYTINGYNMAGTPANFVLRGVPGKSIIQRTSAPGSQFFNITASNVVIDGVIFDMNSGSVSANQWGVFLGTGGQNVSVRNSVFKNNSGSLGSCFVLVNTTGNGPSSGGSFVFDGNELTNCAVAGAYIGSVTNGVITNNYFHDTTSFGAFVNSYLSASSTNYVRDITISNNRFFRTANTALEVGGIAPPYIYGTPGAKNILVLNNQFQDNYQSMALQGDYIQATGNSITQSTPSAAGWTGIDCNSRYSVVSHNRVVLAGSSYGIDCGGSVEMTIADNYVEVTSGSALNFGGSINDIVRRNRAVLSGTALGGSIYDVETDGSGVGFPQHTSNLIVEDNQFEMNASGTAGIALYDNPGGFSASQLPVFIRNNKFVGTNGAGSSAAINYFAASAATQISGNLYNGVNSMFANPNGSNDLIFYPVFDSITTFAGASTTIRSIETQQLASYGAGGSIMYVTPSNGGSGYVKASTTLSASAGCTWAGWPVISQGVIYGVRTTSIGTGCNGATITATDPGGGTGATFTIQNIPSVSASRQITVQSGGVVSMIQNGGAFISLRDGQGSIVAAGAPVTLTLAGTAAVWTPTQPRLPVIAVGSLPSCASPFVGAKINVTGSTTNKWQAQCDGTNWRWTDGSIVSG